MTLRQFLERYGLPLGVVLALAVVVAVLPGNTNGTALDVGAGGTASGFASSNGVAAGGATPGAAGTAAGGATPGGAASAAAAGAGGAGAAPGAAQPGAPAAGAGGVVFGQGPNCRPDGRQLGISFYMPPCVQWGGGDNGGATFQGVTADQILVVRYLPQLDPGTKAILTQARLADDPETVKRAYDAIRVYSNQHYETYGREVVFQDYTASGPSESDEAMKADALDIATRIKPFAVIEGDPSAPMPSVLIRELAVRGVLCMCSTTLSAGFYNELPPLIFSSLPTSTEYAQVIAEYICKRVAGRNAIWAGDENNPLQHFTTSPRRFGLIYLQGERGKFDPERQRARDEIVAELAKCGVSFAKEVGYLYDPGRNQNDVTNMVAQMKGAGVTTIVPLWDPLYPILITTEAFNQLYFPEWFIGGTGLSDTSAAGRLYNQQEWAHAFGISPLWVTWADVRNSPGYREYHHGRPQDADGAEGVLVNIYRSRIQTLFRGIHMAGPNLTNESFAAGQYAYPPTGGTPGLRSCT